jgi:hypothetical protein
MWRRKEIREKRSTFMAVRALLGIKTIRGHPEHVVALYADAMNYSGAGGQCGIFGSMRRGRRMFSHTGSLA